MEHIVTAATGLYPSGSRPGYLPPSGRAPYGYRPCPRGGDTALEPDPVTAPVVRRIFEEYVNGSGLQLIAEKLTADGIVRPSAYDPQRNPHHVGRAWSKAAVRAVITNGRYACAHACCSDPTGCRHEHDETRQPALIPLEMYHRTQAILAVRGDTSRAGTGKGPVTGRYALRGLLRCQLCQRLMQGTWNNDTAYYRCRFPREYARANNIEHPSNVYIREDRLVTPLQDWICHSLPHHLKDWAERQPPAVRTRLIGRAQTLRRLVHAARSDRTRRGELFAALGMRLVYEPNQSLLQVRSEVLPGMTVLDAISL